MFGLVAKEMGQKMIGMQKMFVEIDLTKVFFKSVSYKNIFRK